MSASRYAVKAPTRGGRREGAGRRAETAAERLERTLERQADARATVELAAERLIEEIGLPPRRRLLAGEDVVERTDGGWLANFCAKLCIQTIGRWAGKPLELYPAQRAFFDDALAFDDEGRRLYGVAVWEIPRKCGKTTSVASIGLGMASPAEQEGKPSIILAAGSAKQAGPLYEQTIDFVRGHPLLNATFLTSRDGIVCPANGGRIEKVAGDGKLNHGLNPYALGADELHAWVTPKQVENWAALTTADGARDDALAFVISTAGHDLTTILGELHTQAQASPYFEPRPEMGGGGFIVRDPVARLVVHCYAIAPGTPLSDLDEWKRANPAPWRTRERIGLDLAKRHIDESSKRRLYGNEWTSARSAWIPRAQWATLADRSVTIDDGDQITVGVDASHSHDTTAVGWATKLEDGRICVRARIYSVRKDAAAHAQFKGTRIRLGTVERFIAGALLGTGDADVDELVAGSAESGDLFDQYELDWVGFDPRFFNRSAELLSDEGLSTVEYEPTGAAMAQAINDFYDDVIQGRIVHDGDVNLAAHVDAASGEKTERGWRVRRIKASRDIDGLIAVVIAADLARHQLSSRGEERGALYAEDRDGHEIAPDEDELVKVFGGLLDDDEDDE